MIDKPELIRQIMSEIKTLGSEHIKKPGYDLPADSYIEDVAKRILEITNAEGLAGCAAMWEKKCHELYAENVALKAPRKTCSTCAHLYLDDGRIRTYCTKYGYGMPDNFPSFDPAVYVCSSWTNDWKSR